MTLTPFCWSKLVCEATTLLSRSDSVLPHIEGYPQAWALMVYRFYMVSLVLKALMTTNPLLKLNN